jgi:aryl-alcohol dehydrogenase-like predicted oxidoreductase/histidinol phosphatase-like enzyme/predicted kinase
MLLTGPGRLRGIGCMRLSTTADRDDDESVRVIHAALDAGFRFFDTADAYAVDASDAGHNERLIARALAAWSGDRSQVVVATKGGLTRPGGNWVADGRARHLAAACDASRRALGVERIQLYQLHAPDPRTPLATSVRALDGLRRDGLIEAIGLCNVNLGQIEEARRITDIAAVQVELSVWHDDALLDGVAEYCAANRIALIAYRPLGGATKLRRTAGDAVLKRVAAAHDATPFEVAIAWVRDLADVVVPIAGPTRLETVRSVARAHSLTLTDDDRAALDDRIPSGSRMRGRSYPAASPANGEIVLIMGLPGAGKSTLAREYVADGFVRLNRDDAGGSLSALAASLDEHLAAGNARCVLDNTYVSRKSRAVVIEAARRRGVPVRCVWLTTPIEEAQINAVRRILSRHPAALGPEGQRQAHRKDVAAFGPSVQYRYARDLEPPDVSEGFASVEPVAFERRPDPAAVERAVLIWCDGVLWQSRGGERTPSSPDDVEIVPGREATLARYAAEGWRVLGLSWQPEVEAGIRTHAQVAATFAHATQRLGVPVEIEFCPHGAGPAACWCRKPLPGLGVLFIDRHHLDPSRSIYVGAGPQDPGFARRLGFGYREAREFFGV